MDEQEFPTPTLAPWGREEFSTGHLVQFYEEDRFLVDSIVRFIGPGLKAGAPALLIATPAHLEAVRERCAEEGIDGNAFGFGDALVTLDAAEQLSKFMVDGWPDESRFLELGEAWLDRAPAGDTPVRAFGEMVALLWAEGRREAAVRLEALWNVLATRRRFSLLCAYPMRMFRSREERQAFLAVLAEHSHVIPAESYSALLDPEDRLRTITELQQKAEALETEATERARAEAELRLRCDELAEQHRRKDEFLAMLGHELRNPLSSIRAGLYVARVDEAARDEAIGIAERQVDHLARLVDDLLDVARVTQGRIALEREPMPLARLVSGAIEASRTMIDARKHRLSVTLPPDDVYVRGDAVRLEQVLVNLLSNACRYTEPGGRIEILVRSEGNEAVLSVRDDGTGLTPALRAQVFDLFVQGKRSADRSQGGLGVGLTIARRLVELHGGTIEAASEGPGRGSDFTVRLPRIEAPAALTEDLAVPVAPRPTGLRVLVVEDHPDVGRALQMTLEHLGHEVQLIHDGLQAVAAARELRPDVMLVDIGLPGIDGYEVARRLRAEPDLRDLCLTALTGYAGPRDRRKALEAGFDHHLAKPIQVETLEAFLNDRRAAFVRGSG